jgi:hypothetical protein
MEESKIQMTCRFVGQGFHENGFGLGPPVELFNPFPQGSLGTAHPGALLQYSILECCRQPIPLQSEMHAVKR